MYPTPAATRCVAVARAFDDPMDHREVLPERRYLVEVDLSPEGWRATVVRLNEHLRRIEDEDGQLRAEDYRLELHDVTTGAHVLTWRWTDED